MFSVPPPNVSPETGTTDPLNDTDWRFHDTDPQSDSYFPDNSLEIVGTAISTRSVKSMVFTSRLEMIACILFLNCCC